MFGDVVLGVDPGTASVGLATVAMHTNGPQVRWWSTVRTPPHLPAPQRLLLIHAAVRAKLMEIRPEAIAIERLMWGRNSGSAMEVARASGAILLAAADTGVAVEEYAPLEVKMAVTGTGNAPKQQVRRSLVRLFGMSEVPTDPDAADAVAVAVCHLQQSAMRAATRLGSRRGR